MRPQDRTPAPAGRPLPLVPAGLLLLALLVPGCGADTGSGRTVTTAPDGSELIAYGRLDGPALQVDTLYTWDLMGSDEYLFARVQTAAGAPGGFWLLDAGNQQIVRLDAQGHVLNHFGRKGEGPGEFSYPWDLGTRPGEVWVVDLRNRRYTIFDEAGTYLRDISWQQRQLYNSSFALPPGERLLFQEQDSRGLAEIEERKREPIIQRLILMDVGTDEADTLATMTTAPAGPIELRAASGQGVTFTGPPQYSARMRWAAFPDGGTVTVTGEDYRFDIRDPSGRVLRTVEAPTPDLTVTAAVKEWYLTENPPRFGFGTGEMFEPDRESLDNYPFAERRQAITGVDVDSEGRIWVMASTTDPGSDRLDVFTAQGDYLGHIPGLSMPMAFSSGGIALLRADGDDGIEPFYVITLRVPPGTD